MVYGTSAYGLGELEIGSGRMFAGEFASSCWEDPGEAWGWSSVGLVSPPGATNGLPPVGEMAFDRLNSD